MALLAPAPPRSQPRVWLLALDEHAAAFAHGRDARGFGLLGHRGPFGLYAQKSGADVL